MRNTTFIPKLLKRLKTESDSQKREERKEIKFKARRPEGPERERLPTGNRMFAAHARGIL